MKTRLFSSIYKRALHSLARSCPGGSSIRPALHRLRGVKISGSVWIGDDVYLENEYPECIEIHEGVVISLKSIILAHTKGSGRVILERNVFIGPLALVACPSGKVLRIGEGAVISAGAIIMSSVPPHVIMAPPRATAVGRAMVPFWNTTIQEFMAGLEPLRRSSPPAAAAAATAGPKPSLGPNAPGDPKK